MDDQEWNESRLHRQLRRELHQLADRQAQDAPPPPPPVQDVLQQGRLHRRARVGAAVAGVAACAVAAGLLPQSLAGIADPRPSGVAAAPASASATPLSARRLDRLHPPRPPAALVTGTSYPVDWQLSCGPRYSLTVNGTSWREQGHPDWPNGYDRATHIQTSIVVMPGYLTVTGPDTARFEAPGYLRAPVLLRRTAPSAACR
ncbi:hypothetical protein [Streptacidiphilus sp. PAMC 29251]